MVNKARGRTMNVRSGVATGDGDRSTFTDRALTALHALAQAAGGVADPLRRVAVSDDPLLQPLPFLGRCLHVLQGVLRSARVGARRRCAAGDHDRLAQIDGERHHRAGMNIAGACRDAGAAGHQRCDGRYGCGGGIDLQDAGGICNRAAEIGRSPGTDRWW